MTTPVLVTGATGLIGGHLADLLVERGEPVRALVRPGERVDRLVESGVDICWGDLRDRSSLQAAVKGVDRVLHCAARTGAWGPRHEYEATNIQGLKTFLDASLAAGVNRFVHVSSITVMGNDLRGSADETAPLRVERNPYSWSKVMGEKLLAEAIRDQQAPVTIVRPGWVYGPRDEVSFGRFATMVQKRRMPVIGSGKNHVPLIYVRDVAEGILQASTVPLAAGLIYLLVNDEPATQLDYLNTIAAELGVPPPKLHVPYRLSLMLGSLAESFAHAARWDRPPPITRHGMQLFGAENRFVITRAREELGFSPQTMLAEGVRKSIAWYRTTHD